MFYAQILGISTYNDVNTFASEGFFKEKLTISFLSNLKNEFLYDNFNEKILLKTNVNLNLEQKITKFSSKGHPNSFRGEISFQNNTLLSE